MLERKEQKDYGTNQRDRGYENKTDTAHERDYLVQIMREATIWERRLKDMGTETDGYFFG